jgi:hypothetical protein
MPQRPSGRRTSNDQNPPVHPNDPSVQSARTRSRGNGFYDAPVRVLLGGKPVHLAVCGRCGSYVPGGSEAAKAQQLHKAFHEQIDSHDAT